MLHFLHIFALILPCLSSALKVHPKLPRFASLRFASLRFASLRPNRLHLVPALKSSSAEGSLPNEGSTLPTRTWKDTEQLLLSSMGTPLSAEERASIDVDALFRADPERKRDVGWLLEGAETFFRLGADLDAFAFAEDAFRAFQWASETQAHILLIHALSAAGMGCAEVYLKMLEGVPGEPVNNTETNNNNDNNNNKLEESISGKDTIRDIVQIFLNNQPNKTAASPSIGHYALFKDTRPEREPDYVRAVLQNYREHRKTLTLARTIEDSLDAVDVVPCPEKGGFKMIATRPIAKDECFFEETPLVGFSKDDMDDCDAVMFFDASGKDTGWLRFTRAHGDSELTLLALKLLVLIIGHGLVPPPLVEILPHCRDKGMEDGDKELGACTGVSKALELYYDFQRVCPSLSKSFGARAFFLALFTVKAIAHTRRSSDGSSGIFVLGNFINHSSEPAASYGSSKGKIDNKLRFTALRDIATGEEITINFHEGDPAK